MPQEIVIKPMDQEFHQRNNFREQLFSLYFVGVHEEEGETYAKLIRSHIRTCQPGAASCDRDNPGADTPKAFAHMDDLIENHRVRGFFHTHPLGMDKHSGQDDKLHKGFAQTYGPRLLWHGVQSVDSKYAWWICAHMIGSHTIIHELGFIPSDLGDPVVLVPMPPKFETHKNVSRVQWW